MRSVLLLIGLATAFAVTATSAFALTETPNCSSGSKANWAKCVIEESQKGHDG